MRCCIWHAEVNDSGVRMQVAAVSSRVLALRSMLGSRDELDLVWMLEREPRSVYQLLPAVMPLCSTGFAPEHISLDTVMHCDAPEQVSLDTVLHCDEALSCLQSMCHWILCLA